MNIHGMATGRRIAKCELAGDSTGKGVCAMGEERRLTIGVVTVRVIVVLIVVASGVVVVVAVRVVQDAFPSHRAVL